MTELMVEYTRHNKDTLMYLYSTFTLAVMYYLYCKLETAWETIEKRDLEIQFLQRELAIKTRNVKFYKYCFTTQKKAETVYQQEITDLRRENTTLTEQLDQQREQKEETGCDFYCRKRTVPFAMTLRPRDETGKVKRRKVSDTSHTDTETDTDTETETETDTGKEDN